MPPPPTSPFSRHRLKPIQKMEGMTNGVAVGQQPPAGLSDISTQVQQYQQFLGEDPPTHTSFLSPCGPPPRCCNRACVSPRCPADASRTLAEFPEIDLQGKPLPEGACAEDVKVFQLLYREHCEVGGVPHPFPQIPAPPFLALGEPPDTLHCPPYTPTPPTPPLPRPSWT